MKLKELIDMLDGDGTQAVEISQIQPYRNLLRAYFSAYYTSAPVLIAVAVFNAAQYCIIAPSDEIHDAIVAYDVEAAADEELMETYTCYITNL
jgi:hypothetical protein